LAAVLACGPGAVLSHRSAAAHWELLATDQVRIDVTATRGRHSVPGIRLHTSRSLDAQDTTNHENIPITTVHRTLLDLAATVRDDQLERALAKRCTCSSTTSAPSTTSSRGPMATGARAS
jgi:predicted transcriptional regulator of viral defense system